MRGRLALAFFTAVALVAAAPLMSGPSSRITWTLETVKLARSGDAAKGKKLHADCAQCHGEAGNVDIPDVPDLGGQNSLYIYKQLSDYKAGSRVSSIMTDIAATLSDHDMADLAAFYAAQKTPRSTGKPAPPNPAAVKLATVGDGARLIPACDVCHGDRGAGNPSFYGMPALKDQKSQDLAVQLMAFRSSERANDVYRVMRDPCKHLTDSEIGALASYYSGAPPEQPPAISATRPPEKK